MASEIKVARPGVTAPGNNKGEARICKRQVKSLKDR